MFENSGAKLKVLAWILFFLEWIGAIASGIILWVDVADGKAVGFLYLLACVMGGFLFAWISSLILYAIGEAAEGASEGGAYARELYKKAAKRSMSATSAPSVAPVSTESSASVPESEQQTNPDPGSITLTCPKCGWKNDTAQSACSRCGARLS